VKKSISTVIISTFSLGILIGALLLMLPFSTTRGHLSIEDALFTSASAVTVTGLIVVDTATHFTTFGQIVILILLQMGGLGFMTFSTFTILVMGKNFSLKDKQVLENDFTMGSYKNTRELLLKIFIMTFSIEFIGAILLYFQSTNLHGGNRFFSSIFHSISAFCNAGFSIFKNNFEDYTSNFGINITLMMLIILGGIGFLVLSEIGMFIRRKVKGFSKFTLHTKLVIISSCLLIFIGFALILVEELFNKSNNLSFGAKVLSALFQSVTARTAGFNTISIPALSFSSVFLLLILMFIGGSPGSTAGGVKTTSTSIVIAYLRSRLLGKDKIDIFYRNIPAKTIEKAFIVIIFSFLLISFIILLLLTFETKLKMVDLVFETVSAFGTVGLSMGITSQLSVPSKITLIVTMFIGRIGPLTLLIALSKRGSKAVVNYPDENIMIG
jgi:trk system potassium uptake protein TrkH